MNFEELQKSSWTFWGLATCTVASLVLAAWFGVSSLPNRSIAYHVGDTQEFVIPDGVSASILVDDKKYSNVSELRTYAITIWNNGNLAVGSDLVREPTSIEYPAGKMISVEVAETNSSSTAFSIASVDGQLNIDWKNLEPNQAIKVTVTGELQRRSILINGTYADENGQIRSIWNSNPAIIRLSSLQKDYEGKQFWRYGLRYSEFAAYFAFIFFIGPMLVFGFSKKDSKLESRSRGVAKLSFFTTCAVLLLLPIAWPVQEFWVFGKPPI